MVTSWPPNLPGPGTSAAWLADKITKMSDGKLSVEGLRGWRNRRRRRACLTQSAQGAAEDVPLGADLLARKSPGIVLFGNMPFGLMASEQHGVDAARRRAGALRRMYARFGLKGFLCGNTGNQWMGWFKREIKSVDDFKGLRFRTPGLGGEMYRRVGASVVQLPGGKIFQAFQSGRSTPAEFIGPWIDAALDFIRRPSSIIGPVCRSLHRRRSASSAKPNRMRFRTT